MKNIFLSMIMMFTVIYADFTRDDSTHIVTDNNTMLQWQDDTNASSVSKTWTEAITHCETLSLGGYSNWRLPNFNELYFIADRSKRNPAMDSTFQNVSSNYYWSSTTVVGYGDGAWIVDFYDGGVGWGAKSNSHYVRCVRDGQ